MAFFDYPAERAPRVAHPPNYDEQRRSIEFEYRFTTNSFGLRYREIPLARQSDIPRILVLGDSYVEGLGVDARDRFTERLEQAFTKANRPVHFINGGLSGTAPREYARVFESVGLNYSPDAVMICVFANDVANTPDNVAANASEQPRHPKSRTRQMIESTWPRIYTLLSTLKEHWQYRRRTRTTDFINDVSSHARELGINESRIQAWTESLPSDVVDAINHNRFGFGVLAYGLIYPQFWADSLDLQSERSQTKWRNMVRSLDQIVATAKQADMTVLTVFLPVQFQYDPRAHQPQNLAARTGTIIRKSWLSERSALENALEGWAQAHDIAFFSLTPTFRAAIKRQTNLDYALDGHWTPAGHEVAAQALAKWLRTQPVLGAPATNSSTQRPAPDS